MRRSHMHGKFKSLGAFGSSFGLPHLTGFIWAGSGPKWFLPRRSDTEATGRRGWGEWGEGGLSGLLFFSDLFLFVPYFFLFFRMSQENAEGSVSLPPPPPHPVSNG